MQTVQTLAIAALLTISPALAETPVATEQMTKAQARERLAACGTQWQQMKRSGSEGSLIWREFSKTCMARAANPPANATVRTNAGGRNENASPAR
ncbi:MAG: hypothetical protein JWN07_270 [Hyphomicrobiales bacterium]|nr:hypothetical protein [Hyphomicrobiales bacterium]